MPKKNARFTNLSILMTTTVLVTTACFLPSQVNAQDKSAGSKDTTIDEITVKGFRTSLKQARDVKRNASVVQDSIVAEDIANFPDLNLAESLQRLPGVSINREAGEGRRVSLRGLGPDFTRVQLNNMEVLGNVDSPQDSRGQRTRDRAFDFNIFASELFSRIDVRKSSSAEIDEGGLAGTVRLYTAKPFDYDGLKIAASLQGGTNTRTEDFQPRFAGLLSNNWGDGTFGALVSVAYSSRETEEQGYNTFRWRPRNASGSNISTLSPADQAAINSGELFFPRGNRLSVWQSEQERLGITGALQFAPTDTINLTFDVLYGEFTGDRDELHLASRGSSSTLLGGGATVDGVVFPNSTINRIEFNSANEVVLLDVSGANLAVETRRQIAENSFQQYVASGDWQVTDRFNIAFLAGTETSDYELPISDKFYFETFGGVVADYRGDRFLATNSYDFDTTDPANWRAHEIDFEEVSQSSSFDNVKLDFTYDLLDGSNIKFGASFRSFFNTGFRRTNDNVLRSELQSGAVDDDITGLTRTFTAHLDQDWAITDDLETTLVAFGVIRDAGPRGLVFAVEEDTLAAYLQYNWNTQIFGIPFRGNAGGRYFETTVTSSGETNLGPTIVEETYQDFLPSLNAVLEVDDNILLRFAASRDINRPPLTALAINGNITIGDDEIRASVGNPGLEPFDAINLDASFEWYFGDFGLVSAGVFLKDIDGFIGTETLTNVPFSATGLSSALSPVLTPDTILAEFSRPINFEQTVLTGIELAAQSDFIFLPAPFNGLGIAANLTLVDGELDYASIEEQQQGISRIFGLEGLSDTTANITLYFENDLWGARTSVNYRSDYIQQGTPTGNDEDSRGFNGTTYVDIAAFYNVAPGVKLTLDIINVTNTREEQYSDSARRLYNTTTAGTTFIGGITMQF